VLCPDETEKRRPHVGLWASRADRPKSRLARPGLEVTWGLLQTPKASAMPALLLLLLQTHVHGSPQTLFHGKTAGGAAEQQLHRENNCRRWCPHRYTSLRLPPTLHGALPGVRPELQLRCNRKAEGNVAEARRIKENGLEQFQALDFKSQLKTQ